MPREVIKRKHIRRGKIGKRVEENPRELIETQVKASVIISFIVL